MKNAINTLARRLNGQIISILGLCLALLEACTAQKPTIIVKLQISDSGLYSIEGTNTPKEALAGVLRSKEKPDHTLVVYIVPTQKTTVESVQYATKIANEIGASVAFVGNERF